MIVPAVSVQNHVRHFYSYTFYQWIYCQSQTQHFLLKLSTSIFQLQFSTSSFKIQFKLSYKSRAFIDLVFIDRLKSETTYLSKEFKS